MAASQVPSAQHRDIFDYVIVGGGLGGLVVATRLAEDATVSVCVLEAGQDVSQDPKIQVPGFMRRNLGNPNIDWMHSSTPQSGANDRSVLLNRGRGLGGSTLLNFMQLGRASAGEYDAFEALGSKGWNWKELLRYFKKSESLAYSEEAAERLGVKADLAFHGTSGPLFKTLPRWSSDTHNPFIEACKDMGIPFNVDSHAGNNVGVWPSGMAVHPETVTRCSSATAYYDPNKQKPNLTVITNARATRVLFKPNLSADFVAESVEYLKDGSRYVCAARKEIILSAGAFHTPSLLELSGIGDANILKQHGIPVKVDLPSVGRNLQDHYLCTYTAEIDSKYETYDALADPKRAAEELQLYNDTRKGLLTSVLDTYAFLPLQTLVDDDRRRELQSAVSSTIAIDNLAPGEACTTKVQQDWILHDRGQIPHLEIIHTSHFIPSASKPTPEAGKRYFSLVPMLMHPFSRGSVHISSADPLAQPSIDLGIFNGPGGKFDLQILFDAFKLARKFPQTSSLRPIITNEVSPGKTVQTDEELEEYIKNHVSTCFHTVGTCSMLPRDSGGVVDEELRVYGTANLRVVDASVIPVQISAHIQATLYAVAERAADLIKYKVH